MNRLQVASVRLEGTGMKNDYLFLAKVHLGIAVIWRQLQMWELAKHHQAMCSRMIQLAEKRI